MYAERVFDVQIGRFLKNAATGLGFHVVRQANNPLHTLLGLKRFDIRTVLDIGANTGQFARWIRETFPQTAIYCFEPTPSAFEHLRAWSNQQPRVTAVQMALGEYSGKTEIYLHKQHSPSSSLLPTTERTHELYPFTADQEKVSVTIGRLDDYVGSLRLPLTNDILVKLDVQGFEGPVLNGGRNTLANARACIIEVGIEDLYVGQSTFKDVTELLDATGMHYSGNLSQSYGKGGEVLYVDALFVRHGTI